jgi:hypothetical protein
MRSLLWTIHANAYWTATKLATFTSVSLVCPQCGQHTERMVCALIDCQSVRLFWANMLSFISDQADPMSDVDAILQFRLSADMHTHRSTKPVFWHWHVVYGWYIVLVFIVSIQTHHRRYTPLQLSGILWSKRL